MTMTTRIVAAAFAVALLVPLAASAQEGAREIPRRADGRPDLSGTYDTATLTPLQRPERFGDRLTLTPEEAATVAADPFALRAFFNIAPSGSDERGGNFNAEAGDPNREAPPAGGDGSAGAAGNVGGYNTFWIDRGTGVFQVDGEWRTSIITDPANGRRPPADPRRAGRGGANGRHCSGRTPAPPGGSRGATSTRPGPTTTRRSGPSPSAAWSASDRSGDRRCSPPSTTT